MHDDAQQRQDGPGLASAWRTLEVNPFVVHCCVL